MYPLSHIASGSSISSIYRFSYRKKRERSGAPAYTTLNPLIRKVTIMSNPQPTPRLAFLHILEENRPQAIAWLQGGSDYPQISGLVKFYDTPYGGILIETELFNLPNISIPGSTSFYALHIHEYGDCSQNFSKTGEHYNPDDQPHPWHSGDLLPLLGNQGYAWDAFYDKRFQIKDILNRSVILHKNSDDFITQPSGNSGQKIACGIIRSNRS